MAVLPKNYIQWNVYFDDITKEFVNTESKKRVPAEKLIPIMERAQAMLKELGYWNWENLPNIDKAIDFYSVKK